MKGFETKRGEEERAPMQGLLVRELALVRQVEQVVDVKDVVMLLQRLRLAWRRKSSRLCQHVRQHGLPILSPSSTISLHKLT